MIPKQLHVAELFLPAFDTFTARAATTVTIARASRPSDQGAPPMKVGISGLRAPVVASILNTAITAVF
jgi:hypothetical protein